MHCKGLAGRIFGHNFRPVFDTVTPEGLASEVALPYPAGEFLRAIALRADRFYKGHVCTRCGYRAIREL